MPAKKEKQYDWNAEDYARNSSVQKEWARELIPKLKLRGYESILDIGCGDGKITAEIAGHLPGGNIIGIDSSKEMIELSNSNFSKEEYPNLSFICLDARNLNFRERFHIIFSNAVLHWVKDHNPVLAGIKNSLKKQGRILLQMGGKGNAEEIISTLEMIFSENKWCRYFSGFDFPYRFYDKDEYKKLLNEHGITPLRVELIPKLMSYDNKEGLAGWVRTTWLPYTERVPDSFREEFVNLIVEKYIENNPLDNKGRVHVNMVRLEVEAVKN